MEIELCVMQFWSEIILEIRIKLAQRARAILKYDFVRPNNILPKISERSLAKNKSINPKQCTKLLLSAKVELSAES